MDSQRQELSYQGCMPKRGRSASRLRPRDPFAWPPGSASDTRRGLACPVSTKAKPFKVYLKKTGGKSGYENNRGNPRVLDCVFPVAAV